MWLALVLAAGFPAGAEDVPAGPAPAVGPPAKWATPVFFTRLEGSAGIAPGEDQRWLLHERQIHVGENAVFYHSARQILSIAGVQNGSNLSVDYHPSYQTLTFHWVNLWRGTNRINCLAADKIRIIQPERDLDQYLFSGKRSAVLILEGVQVGDVIDCAYSIQGANPVMVGKFRAEVPVQFQQPIEHLMTRVLCPASRQLFSKNHRCEVKPKVTRTKDEVEIKWDAWKVPSVKMEDALPDWFDPEPWVQISEYKNWTEVNSWALGLFQNSAPLSPELKQKIAQWQQLGSRQSQVAAVLRFIQDQVRYFGIEIAANSHQPAAPTEVFSRRFGDCKDKALLFVTILRALGIEAYPVLVNTRSCGTLAEWHPSAVAFNHVIAQVRVAGETYWLDPTDSYQRGPLAAYYLPNYGLGLVIHPKTTGLTPIPHSNGWPQTTVSEYFTLRGRWEPADLKIVTVSEGLDAETLRMQFASQPRDQIEKSFLAHFTGVYAGIKSAGPVQYTDDEERNRVEITEFYTIERMWTRSERDQSYYCQFYPYDIAGMLKQPVDKTRAMPLAVPFPRRWIVRTEVTLPVSWPGLNQNKSINDPAFFFEMSLQRAGTSLVMEYEYNSQADSVPAQRAPEYLRKLEAAVQSLGTTLIWQ